MSWLRDRRIRKGGCKYTPSGRHKWLWNYLTGEDWSCAHCCKKRPA